MAIVGPAVQHPQTGRSGAEPHFWHSNVGHADFAAVRYTVTVCQILGRRLARKVKSSPSPRVVENWQTSLLQTLDNQGRSYSRFQSTSSGCVMNVSFLGSFRHVLAPCYRSRFVFQSQRTLVRAAKQFGGSSPQYSYSSR